MSRLRPVDYHVHSTFSNDAGSSVREMCNRAVDLGLVEIGFADHMDFQVDPISSLLDYDRYTREIERTRRELQDSLVIRKGVEIDYQSRFEDTIQNWLRAKRFDFVIGSVHYVDGVLIDGRLRHADNLGYLYERYFSEVVRSTRTGLFDVVGHLDLVGRFVRERDSSLAVDGFATGMGEVLDAVVDSGMYLEINGKALDEKYGDTMPSREAVGGFLSRGGRRVSVGSDAHLSGEVGRGVSATLGFLAECGARDLELPFAREIHCHG